MITPGIYPERTAADHRAIDLPSPSGLYALSRSPAAWLHQQQHPISPTPQMRFGTLCHALVLEGRAPDGMVLRPVGIDLRTKEGREWRQALPDGAEIVDAEDYARARAVAESVRSHPIVGRWLEIGRTEISMVWDDPQTEIRLKGRADLVVEDPQMGWVIADLKILSCGPDYEQVARAVYSSGYWLQIPLYCDAWKTLTGESATGVVIAVDSAAPHGVGVYPMSPVYQMQGLSRARELLMILRDCQETGEFWRDDRDFQPLGNELNAPRWADAGE